MKKLCFGSVVLIGLFFFLNVSCNALGNRDTVSGNGTIISSERTLNPFEKIYSDCDVEIRFHVGQNYRAVITVDSNLEEYVELKIKDRTLNVGTKSGELYSFSTFVVDVYCPSLTGVSISGSGHFMGMGEINATSFEANVSGRGKIDINVICSNLTSRVSGSGELNIVGTGLDSNFRISGSGSFNGLDFMANNASARVSGSGNLYIWISENLEANVSGSGNIVYRGNPKVNFRGSGSGNVRGV